MSSIVELACPKCNRDLLSGAFEVHGLGTIECPHCHQTIDIGQVAKVVPSTPPDRHA
jgi:hypothetical protein